MTDIERIDPATRYSEAVIVNGLVFCSGMVPENPEASATEQTADILGQIERLLERCHSSKARIVDATIYLRSLDDYAAMNSVWDAWLEPGCAPARATVEAALADPRWKVEIKVIAAQ